MVARTLRGWTQERVSRASGVDICTLSLAENGKVLLTAQAQLALIRTLFAGRDDVEGREHTS